MHFVYGAEIESYPFVSKTQSLRFTSLTKEIRCVVCQNQNIAESNAPLAHDLRTKVYRMVVSGQSDDVIKNYLVKRYGEFILLQPRFNQHTFLLWLFPLFILPFAFIFVYRTINASKKITD